MIQIKERFESFVPYIEEDRVKKFETLQKYKLELLELNRKEQELQKLKLELQVASEKYVANMHAAIPVIGALITLNIYMQECCITEQSEEISSVCRFSNHCWREKL